MRKRLEMWSDCVPAAWLHISAKSCQPFQECVYNLQVVAETPCTEFGAYHSPLPDGVFIIKAHTTLMLFYRTCETPTPLSFDIKKIELQIFHQMIGGRPNEGR
jgi:hypothetical protein